MKTHFPRTLMHTLLLLLLLIIMTGCSSAGSGPNGTGAKISDLIRPTESTSPLVQLPEGTLIIDAESLDEKSAQLEKAIRDRVTSVCVKSSIAFTWDQFYAMDSGSFWLESYATGSGFGRFSGDKEKSLYCLYEFTYYDLTEEEIREMKAALAAKIAEITALVPADADIWEKARLVHDELIRRVSYDQSLKLPHCHDAYGALVNGMAVCSGYASAFSTIMAVLGERCPMVVSDTHAWNRIGARTFEDFIDVTWDDLDLKDGQGHDYIHYSFFGLTREEVEAVDAHVIEGGANAYTNYLSDPITFNYCGHEGYRFASYDESKIINALAAQLEAGKNILMLRFDNPADFARAAAWWNGDSEELSRILSAAGLQGQYLYWITNEVQTVMIGLDPILY